MIKQEIFKYCFSSKARFIFLRLPLKFWKDLLSAELCYYNVIIVKASLRTLMMTLKSSKPGLCCAVTNLTP